jgi:ribosomal protein L37E
MGAVEDAIIRSSEKWAKKMDKITRRDEMKCKNCGKAEYKLSKPYYVCPKCGLIPSDFKLSPGWRDVREELLKIREMLIQADEDMDEKALKLLCSLIKKLPAPPGTDKG